MLSALDSGSSGSGSNAGQGHYVMFLGKTLLTLIVLFSSKVYKCVPANCRETWQNAVGKPGVGLASHPGGVPILLLGVIETDISSGSLGQFGPVWPECGFRSLNIVLVAGVRHLRLAWEFTWTHYFWWFNSPGGVEHYPFFGENQGRFMYLLRLLQTLGPYAPQNQYFYTKNDD